MERPKYLEYRHRRDQITVYKVNRTTVTTLEKPGAALLRLVGRKTSAKRETYHEEWMVELRTTDVRPNYSALVKIQVTEAARLVKGEDVGYAGMTDPKNEFLNETVDRFGILTEHHGTLPTPHLVVFPEAPQATGGEWENQRQEMLAVYAPEGSLKGHEPMSIVYRGRVDSYGEINGVEYADISLSGAGKRGEEGDPTWQEFTVIGNVRFAVRDRHMLTAKITRSLATHLDQHVLTTTCEEEFAQSSQGTEESVGGMRI